MDGRFFSIPRSSHRPAYYYPIPVQRQTLVKSPKVVSIPVQCAESEQKRTRSRSESAAKIQAGFRGFMVRKYVRKIDMVRREVEEIERRISEEETVEPMRSEEREWLKVNEALMSLLFRLDSVRGVDAGVREFRKKVIKKAIALQEKIDAIAAAADFADQKEGGADEVEQSEVGVDSPDAPDQEGDSTEDEQIEEQVTDLSDRKEGGCTDVRSEEPVLDLPDQKKEGGVEDDQSEVQIADVVDQKEGCGLTESENRDIDSPDQEEGGAEAKQIEDQVSNSSSGGLDHVVDNVNDACDLLMEMEPSAFETSTSTSGESGTDPSLNRESFLEEVDENAPIKDNEAEAVDLFEKEVEESAEENGHVGKDKNTGDGKYNNRSQEMLGRMMEDNEKMMGMMVQLFERNERQTQLLSLLSQRVERLEKAFLCEKLRRKKRKDATEVERLLNPNKCGKKF